MIKYTYSLANDFTTSHALDIQGFLRTIERNSAIGKVISLIEVVGDVVTISFGSQLTESELTALITEIANHVPAYVPDGSKNYTSYSISPVITSPTYTVESPYYNVYQFDTVNNNITVTLPPISTLSETNYTQAFYFVDVGGNITSTKRIVLNRSSTDLIAGKSTIQMNVNYSSLQLLSNQNGSTGKWLIL